MTTEITLQEVADRLQSLEVKVNQLSEKLALKPVTPEESAVKFTIMVDDKAVWTGVEVDKQLPEIFRKYPDSQISINVHSIPFVWI